MSIAKQPSHGVNGHTHPSVNDTKPAPPAPHAPFRLLRLSGPFSKQPTTLAQLTITRPNPGTFEILCICLPDGLVRIGLDGVFAKALRHELNAELERLRRRGCSLTVDLMYVFDGLKSTVANGDHSLSSVDAKSNEQDLLVLTFSSERGPTVLLFPSLERCASILHDLDTLL